MKRLALGLWLFLSPVLVQAQDKLFDAPNVAAFSVHAGLRAIDVAQTCIRLAHGGHEDFLPWQSCRAVAAYSFSMIPAQIGATALLRNRPRLQKVTHAAFIAPVVYALIYSARH